MKIIIAPNAFKECMDSQRVADYIEQGLKIALPKANIQKIPLVDGGDGSLQVILQAKGGKIYKKL